MATLTTSAVASTVSAKAHGFAGNVKVAQATYTLTAALALNDVIQMVKLPANSTVHEVTLITTDLDTNGSPAIVLDVGYGSDTDYLIDGSTIGQAGGVARINTTTAATPLTLTAEDTIDVLVQVAPATGATSGSVHLTVFYSVA